MILDNLKLPLYAKVTIFLVGLFVLFTILYIARGIIVPLIFSIIIAIVLHPVVNIFVRRKINRIVAIVFTLILTFLVIAALFALLFSQANRFSESWPVLVDKFTLLIHQSVTWASGYFDIDPILINAWIVKTKSELIFTSSASIGQTLVMFGRGIVVLFIIPVYVFLLLFYHPLLIDFVRKLFGESNKSKVSEIVTLTKNVIQRYLVGLVIEFILVSALNIAALLLLGIDYAILLGIIGGLLNIIPYFGGLAAMILPMMIALVTKDSAWYVIYVFVSYYIIQLIDNNYFVPKIVASKVKINALFALLVVFAGSALWGIPGMFLSIPLLAIVKLIFDHVEPLKPWGFLLGDTMPPIIKNIPIDHLIRRIKKSK